MKKTILKSIIFAFSLCITFYSEAQIEKGMKVLTGSLSFNTSTDKRLDTLSNSNNKNSTIRFSPSIGFFVSDKFCVGAAVPLNYSFGTNISNYNNTMFSNNQSSKSQTFGYGITPYVRYYMKITDKFYGYLNGSINFGLSNRSVKTESTYTDLIGTYMVTNSYSNKESKSMYYNYSANVNFGLMYFISPKLALEASLAGIGYSGSDTKDKDKSYDNYQKQSGLSASIAPNNINFGLSYFFK